MRRNLFDRLRKEIRLEIIYRAKTPGHFGRLYKEIVKNLMSMSSPLEVGFLDDRRLKLIAKFNDIDFGLIFSRE